jgi:hypothetical protein
MDSTGKGNWKEFFSSFYIEINALMDVSSFILHDREEGVASAQFSRGHHQAVTLRDDILGPPPPARSSARRRIFCQRQRRTRVSTTTTRLDVG